ncbi:hypothetical protein RND81_13G079100 [Saponaria officinalis]|uniref:Uncharacterized protein n=1 Tax=Saponaria officinalis TaxID=3572 RepID=A0AAW1H1J6_SAPOF
MDDPTNVGLLLVGLTTWKFVPYKKWTLNLIVCCLQLPIFTKHAIQRIHLNRYIYFSHLFFLVYYFYLEFIIYLISKLKIRSKCLSYGRFQFITSVTPVKIYGIVFIFFKK